MTSWCDWYKIRDYPNFDKEENITVNRVIQSQKVRPFTE